MNIAAVIASAEPLQSPPDWSHTPGAGWHDATALVATGRVESPASFVQGYEAGVFALAKLLYPLAWSLDDAKRKEAMVILRRYHDGAAHPVRGWEHEPKRS